jgi:hypothetical protein
MSRQEHKQGYGYERYDSPDRQNNTNEMSLKNKIT